MNDANYENNVIYWARDKSDEYLWAEYERCKLAAGITYSAEWNRYIDISVRTMRMILKERGWL